jgi:hypothetical protein
LINHRHKQQKRAGDSCLPLLSCKYVYLLPLLLRLVDLAVPDLLVEPVLREDDFTDLPALDCLTVEEAAFPELLELVLLAGEETLLPAVELLLVTVADSLVVFTLLRAGVVTCLLFTLLRAGVVTCLLLLLVTVVVCLVAELLPAAALLLLTTLLLTGVVTL